MRVVSGRNQPPADESTLGHLGPGTEPVVARDSEELPSPDGSVGRQSFGEVPPRPPSAMHRYRGWARLRSMRTAIWLLIAVAAASVLGSVVPQKNNSSARVARFMEDHPFWGTVLDRLMLFEVFTSWWFLSLVGALLLVLFLCLLPRTTAFFRDRRKLALAPAVGKPPPVPTEAALSVSGEADRVLEAVRQRLRKLGWKISRANEAGQFVAEKGGSREAGSLLFHWALFLLFIAGALTVTTKFEGYVALVEGQRWFEGGKVNFDEYSEGAFARFLSRHRGFYLTLDDFEVRYRENGMADDYVSRVRLEDPGSGATRSSEIRVNKPLSYRGVKVYQASYGWAAAVSVRQSTRVLYEGPVLFFGEELSSGPAQMRGVVGVVKVPQASPEQAGIELRFFPDFRIVPYKATNPEAPEAEDPTALDLINVSDEARRPLVLVTEYRGDLGLDRPQNVYRLDKSRLRSVQQRFITFPEFANDRLPSSVELSDGLNVELRSLRRFSVFQVRSDIWGSSVAGIAAAVVFASLFPALYGWRRRLWVWVRPLREAAEVGEPNQSEQPPRWAPRENGPCRGNEDREGGADESGAAGYRGGRKVAIGTASSATSSEGDSGKRQEKCLVELRAVAFQRKDLLESEFERVVSEILRSFEAEPVATASPGAEPAELSNKSVSGASSAK